ncbi:uncharacterized protein VP01_677g6 [Puccinia sorghi]|uniref:Retrotransposon gag domain-containing protein n=1 Tax=Puccinia sorghi TaxID=27349 RepID=A0A0L6UEJ4_9BASI|nr:uncharacterized protein VP01_677g6 [Puccinia sorghi]
MDALNAWLDEVMQMIAKERNNWPQRRLSDKIKPTSMPHAAAKPFIAQIGLHAVTYLKQFPTNTSKVAFAALFMQDYAATWSQLYLTRLFNGEKVVFSKFMDDFKSSFFDHNCRHCAEVALRNF